MSGDTGRWLVLALVVLGTSGGLWQYYEHTRPCAEPLEYSFGEVDARFSTTHAELAAIAEAAASIWNTAAGKTLFVYVPTAAFKINLVYDDRQAAVVSGQSITREKERLSIVHTQLATESATCGSTCGAAHARMVTEYNQRTEALNAAIQQYNESAGYSFKEGQFIRDASGERIVVYEFVDSLQLERVLAHEFGHALGLEHTTDPASIMYAENESGNLVPTAEDLSALRAVCK